MLWREGKATIEKVSGRHASEQTQQSCRKYRQPHLHADGDQGHVDGQRDERTN